MTNLQDLLEQSKDLPTLPEIYVRVSELLDSDTASVRDIGEAVQTDPSLTAKILKLVNSAFYGLPNRVTSISQSVSLLGRQQLKQVLMSSVLAGVFSDINIVNFSMHDFWHHSIKTAIIARHLGMQNVNIIDHEAFFTAGLLHDIGRLVIAKVAPEEMSAINDFSFDNAEDLLKLELEKLGMTHVEVGAAMLKKWKMPGLLTQCVLNHHETSHSGPLAIDTSIVYLANLLSQQEMPEDEEALQEVLDTIENWQQTDCSLEQVYIACQLAEEQVGEVMQSLGMVDLEISDDDF